MNWTEQKIQRFIIEGRGQGEGTDYRPWLTTRDMPKTHPEPITVHAFSWKHRRSYYALTEIDDLYFHVLNWNENVLDIRESYPLPRSATLKIAEELQIPHKRNRGSKKTPLVMTTSFLVTLQDETTHEERLEAHSVAWSDDAEGEDVKNDFAIQERYWSSQGIRWRLVTERNIPPALVYNDHYFFHFRYGSGYDIDEYVCQHIMEHILLHKAKYRSLEHFVDGLSQFGLDKGDINTNLFYLIANKVIDFDATNIKFDTKLPIHLFRINYVYFTVSKVIRKVRWPDGSTMSSPYNEFELKPSIEVLN